MDVVCNPWLLVGVCTYGHCGDDVIDPLIYRPCPWMVLLEFLLVSRNQENRVGVGFNKLRARESFVRISVCGVKVVLNYPPPHTHTFNIVTP